MRAALVALSVLLTCVLSAPSAQATGGEPSVRVTRATIVAHGAALEVSYSITCPDTSQGRHALWTTVQPSAGARDVMSEYLEFTCATRPVTVTNLVSSQGRTRFEKVPTVIETTVTNALYFELEEPLPGYYRVHHNATVRPKPGRFVPESTVDIDADLQLVRTRLRPDGAVELTHRLSCMGDWFGFFPVTVTQASRAGLVRARGFSEVECGSRPQKVTSVLRSEGSTFVRGKIVVEAAFTVCEEGCVRAFDTSAPIVRSGRGPR